MYKRNGDNAKGWMDMLKRFFALALGLAVLVSLFACNSESPIAGSKSLIIAKPVAFKPADSLQPSVGTALNAFSFDLFQRLAARDAGKNVFISPLSVWLALSMTYNGASGTTAKGMAEALHASEIPMDDLNISNAGLMGVLTAADPKVKIDIANSIWLNKAYEKTIEKKFLDINSNNYGAEVRSLDFQDPAAADAMNAWVEKKTNGKIKNLVQPPLSPQDVMALINAIYFKAPWKQPFDPKLTNEGDFTAANGGTVKAQYMMRREDNFGYADEDVRVVRLPYATGRLELAAVMPDKQQLSDFIKGLTPEMLQTYLSKCQKTGMRLTFPKFKLEYAANLNDTLISMGMKDAFDKDAAEFLNMSGSQGDLLYISNVVHKAFIEVDEKGTEAAAATEVMMTASAMMMELDFKKPFIYMIRDTITGAMLFIGTMNNPN